jgi:Ca-activated chloride channel family protein
MININYVFEKNSVKKQSDKMLVLLKLKGEKDNFDKTEERRKLNLSLAIDVSSSMQDYLNNKTIQKVRKVPVFKNKKYPYLEEMPKILLETNPYVNNDKNNLIYAQTMSEINKQDIEYQDQIYYERVSNETKLDKAKKAAIKAVEELKDGDILSIVTFSDRVSKVLNATIISKKNKKEIISKINSINAYGNTDLHEGWLQSATEVAQHVSEQNINRVIILTDGQTNCGIKNPKVIEENVLKLYQKGITTSCIGIGESFNETLLEGMSNSGGGNFYYVEKDEELEQVFKDEFSGLTNLVASEVQLSFEDSSAKINKVLNNFKQVENKYLIGNLVNGKEVSILIELGLTIPKGKKSLDLGKINLEYKTKDGSKTEEISLSIPVVSEKVWENMEYNKEVKIQETLMIVSNDKFEIAKAIDEGKNEYAKDLLTRSMNYVATASASGYNDDRLSVESNYLSGTLNNYENASSLSLSKSIRFQSYKTRNNKI